MQTFRSDIRRRRAAAGLAVAAGLATSAAGHNIIKPPDTPGGFALFATHNGDLVADWGGGLWFGGNWATGGDLTEDSGFDWDEVRSEGQAWHVIAPHGEPVNPNRFFWDLHVDGSVWANALGLNAFGPRTGWGNMAVFAELEHPPFHHTDCYVAEITFKVEWDEDLLGYTHTVTGVHSESNEHWQPFYAAIVALPGVDTPAFGSLSGFVEPSGQLYLSAALVNVQRQDVLEVILREGAPGAGGAILYQVNPQSYLDLEGGLGIRLSDEVIPIELVQLTLTSQACIEICTVNAPGGEIGGLLQIAGPEPCPGDVDGDRQVNLSDLATQLANFGLAGGAGPEDGDCDNDGDVDLADLSILLANFGAACP